MRFLYQGRPERQLKSDWDKMVSKVTGFFIEINITTKVEMHRGKAE